MANIVIRNFKGIVPILNPRLLPDGAATIAVNTRLLDGTLGTWKGTTQVATLTKAGTKQTIYRFGQTLDSEAQYWFSWATDVNVVKAPIDNDTSERTYITGDDYPKVTDNTLMAQGGTDYPQTTRRLGVPQPVVTSCTVSVTGSPTDPNSTAYSTAYVITNVTAMGEESMPSAPLGGVPVSFKAGQTVQLRFLPTAPVGPYEITHKRIYRSSTGTATTAYQFVDEIDESTTNYDDSKTPDELGEIVATWGWDMLPATAKGLVLMTNGIGVAFENNQLYLSEPYALYAYPPQYQLSTDSPIVGLGAFGQSVFVGTRANPYILSGVDPSAMQFTRMEQNQACASKRSIVPMMNGVLWASPDGLWMVGPDGMRPMSEGLISRDQWQAYNPSTMHSHEMDGRYVAFFDTGGRKGGLVFDFKNGNLYEVDQYCTAAYNDPIKDKLYVTQTASEVLSWDTNINHLYYQWRSKIYRAPDTVDMGYAKVEAEQYPVELKLLSDGVVYGTYIAQNDRPFRIKRSRVKELQVEVTGNSAVSAVVLAETGQEIEAI
jgi:hypothetical protein